MFGPAVLLVDAVELLKHCTGQVVGLMLNLDQGSPEARHVHRCPALGSGGWTFSRSLMHIGVTVLRVRQLRQNMHLGVCFGCFRGMHANN